MNKKTIIYLIISFLLIIVTISIITYFHLKDDNSDQSCKSNYGANYKAFKYDEIPNGVIDSNNKKTWYCCDKDSWTCIPID